MWLDPIALFLRAQTITGLPTGEVYIGIIPSDVPVGVALTSAYQGMPVDPELPGYHKGPMQMIVRAKKSLDAENIAQLASDLLTFEGVQVGDIYVNYIRPRHLPAVFPRSNGDHYEASVNFDLCFVREIG